MLEVESGNELRSSRRKHGQSEKVMKPTKDNIMATDVSKPERVVKESHFEDDLMLRRPAGSAEKPRRKKHRKKTGSQNEQYDHETTDIAKVESSAHQKLMEANLYTNDKNKSFEKETKQSYNDAMSSWQQSIDDAEKQQKITKLPGEKRPKRVKKKANTLESEGGEPNIETAANVEKARRRLKKKLKDSSLAENISGVDEVDGSGVKRNEQEEMVDITRGSAEGNVLSGQENLAYEAEGETSPRSRQVRSGKSKKKSGSQRTEIVSEHVDVEGDTRREDRQKSGKRRRKRLKESPSDIIHRAMDKKHQDDGRVMCVVIHKADRLRTDLRINHPLVRIHVLNIDTGEYVKKCSRHRAATSYYENQETVHCILPLMTEPFDFKQQKSLVPTWEDVLIINEIYSYFLQRSEGDPKVIIFFEVLDFLTMTSIHKIKNTQKSDRGWYQIAWAFLKLVGSNGSPNTDSKIRLQLYYPVRSFRRNPTLAPEVPEVYHWWCTSSSRVRYPSTLYVTVKGIRPQHVSAAGRSMFAVQEEQGKMTFDELTDKLARGGVSPRDKNNEDNLTTWNKLPGQPNRIPNELMSTLPVAKRGCFVVKFSHDGRKLACACADKEGFSIYLFETLSSRYCCKFQGHFSIIYDLCWSNDDKNILSASSDGTARTWNAARESNQAMKTFPHPCFVYTARHHPRRTDIIVTGGFDCLVRIWSKVIEGPNGQLLREVEGHSGFINTICFDHTGQFMFSGDSKGTVILWNTFEYKLTKSKKNKSADSDDVHRWVISKTVQDPEIKDCIINSVKLHPNGRKLLIHTRDNVTRMLDLRSFTMMTRYIGSNNFKEHIRSTLSSCGSFVFSGSENGLVHVWDTETGDLLHVYSDLGYTAAVSDVDFHPQDNIIAFCSFGENHPVILYRYNNETDGHPQQTLQDSSPTILSPRRTFGQTTIEESLTGEMRTVEHPRMADIASETLLLNKIKKKLDSVLEISSSTKRQSTTLVDTSTLSPDRTRDHPDQTLDTFQRGMTSLSTWGSDFPDTLYSSATLDETTSANKEQSNISSRNIVEQDSAVVKVKAMYPFEARAEDELTFDVGDVISVVGEADENWWMGEMDGGQRGYFPTSYVVLIDKKSRAKELSGKHERKKSDRKQYTAVSTSQGELKILSAPEESDSDIAVTTSRTRRSSPKKSTSSRRQQSESLA